MSSVGHHYIWDIYQCDPTQIAIVAPVKQVMQELISATQLTIIDSIFNQFSPHGVTGIFLLEESHLSAHSWPEHGYLALDLFSCIEIKNLAEIESILTTKLAGCRIEFRQIERGIISENAQRTRSHH